MLELISVEAGYGRAPVLKGISLKVAVGQTVTIIGSNGAGKSTTLRAISGLVPVRKGQIRFLGKRISDRPAHEVVRDGLVHVPEGRRLFGDMTVRENLLMGGYTRERRALRDSLERVYQLFPRLRERDSQLAESLSGGEQQMAAIGRGLMANPTLLMLDEPSLGLAPLLVALVAEMVRSIRKLGITVLLVEQNARLAFELADHAYVLQTGSLAMEGDSATLRNDPFVRKTYLGP